MPKTTGALILAGGSSSRMGYPKPWLQFDERTSFLERIIQIYRKAGIEKIVVVINSEFCTTEWSQRMIRVTHQADVMMNNDPEKGRLYSIRMGLNAIDAENTFIHNVDNPQFSQRLIENMILQHGNAGVTIPVTKGKKGHPVLIGKETRELILANAWEFETLREILQRVRPNFVETNDKGILLNMNTQEQYEDWKHGRTP